MQGHDMIWHLAANTDIIGASKKQIQKMISIENIIIRTISNGTGCYLLGDNKDVYLGSPNLP